ncbi:hypothetical protein ACLOJK_034931, partial [Asimina triloba]
LCHRPICCEGRNDVCGRLFAIHGDGFRFGPVLPSTGRTNFGTVMKTLPLVDGCRLDLADGKRRFGFLRRPPTDGFGVYSC